MRLLKYIMVFKQRLIQLIDDIESVIRSHLR